MVWVGGKIVFYFHLTFFPARYHKSYADFESNSLIFLVPEDGPETKKIKAAKGATATNGGSAAANGAGTPKGKPNGTAKEAANGKTNGSTPSGKTPKKAKA